MRRTPRMKKDKLSMPVDLNVAGELTAFIVR